MNNINFAIQEYVTGSDIKRVRKTLQLTEEICGIIRCFQSNHGTMGNKRR